VSEWRCCEERCRCYYEEVALARHDASLAVDKGCLVVAGGGNVLHSKYSMKLVDVGGIELDDTRHSGAVVGTTTAVMVVRRYWSSRGYPRQDHDDVAAAEAVADDVAEVVAEVAADLDSFAVGECDVAVADSYSSAVDERRSLPSAALDFHNVASAVLQAVEAVSACPRARTAAVALPAVHAA
jgi:hypothetical protein